jgi:hypothetical protein
MPLQVLLIENSPGDARCDEAQGFYFSRPLPAPEFGALLSSGSVGATGFARRPVGSGQRLPGGQGP